MPIINQDGKSYDFRPGEGGSLTVHRERKSAAPIKAAESKAKSIGPRGCRSCSGNVPPAAMGCPSCGDTDASYENALDRARNVQVGSARG